jgi:putative Holliday junction resolvase
MSDNIQFYLALDIGDKRIGVAMANSIARIASPLTTLHVDDTIDEQIIALIKHNLINELIVGLPRGLDGQETEQTKKIRDFVDNFKSKTEIPIHLIDEAGTSLKAKEELALRKKGFIKEDVDSLAASYILEDFLSEK